MTEFQTQLNSTNQLATSIQDARRAKNMTQTELSTITGIPRPWINQLEHGHIENPGFTKLLKIMDALEMRISVSYAIHESTQDSPEEKTSPAPTATTLADAYANLAKNQVSSTVPSMDTVIKKMENHRTVKVHRSQQTPNGAFQELHRHIYRITKPVKTHRTASQRTRRARSQH